MKRPACSVRGQEGLTLAGPLCPARCRDRPGAGPPAPSRAAKAGSRVAEALAKPIRPAGSCSGTWPAHCCWSSSGRQPQSGCLGALAPRRAAGTQAARQQCLACVAQPAPGQSALARRRCRTLLLRLPLGGTTAGRQVRLRQGERQPPLATVGTNRRHWNRLSWQNRMQKSGEPSAWISSGACSPWKGLGDVGDTSGANTEPTTPELLVLGRPAASGGRR